MTSEKDLREQLTTCTRIFAMQGMIGVFGHVSVYQPETKRVLITPGMGSDKGSLRPEDMVPTDLDGKPLEGKNWSAGGMADSHRAPWRSRRCARRRALAHPLRNTFRHR